ncbi:MAG: matrixin family metalloprotease [Myxococcota bacterium]|nr:matrixin family metalloprotease [Myxococcota bacterium]
MDRFFSAVITVLVVVASYNAHGYALRTTAAGTPVRWHQGTVEITLDPSLAMLGNPTDVKRAIIAAFEMWSEQSSVPVAFQFTQKQCSRIGYDNEGKNENCVAAIWKGEEWDEIDEGAAGASTILSFKSGDGEIMDADIAINAADWEWRVDGCEKTALDLTAVVAHEIGHLLGLEHTTEPEAIMYPTTHLGICDSPELHADDIAGVDDLYADFEPILDELNDMYDCSVSSVASNAPSPWPAAIVLFAALMVLRRPARIRMHRPTSHPDHPGHRLKQE